MMINLEASEVAGLFYFNTHYGHLHKTADSFSQTQMNLSCGTPLVVKSCQSQMNQQWCEVEVDQLHGLIQQHFLSKTFPDCFAVKYPQVFKAFKIDVKEAHHWGQLSDFLWRSSP